MGSTSSQRLSFTQLVLEMGLADKKDLLKAKKLIKERKAEGKKLTVARACVELGILSEVQAKKVQRELKRLKEGFASSEEVKAEGKPAAKPKPPAKKKAAKQAPPAPDEESSGGDEPKLGKEIKLDSQRQDRPKAGKGPVAKGKKGPAARKRRSAGAGDAPPPPQGGSKTPLIAVGAGVVVLLLVAVGVGLSGSEPTQGNGGEVAQATPEPGVDQPPSDGPPDTPTTTDAPAPSAAEKRAEAERAMDKLATKALDLADSGKFAEAIEVLESFPQELRDQEAWKTVGQKDLANYKQRLPYQEKFDAALAAAEGGDHDPLKKAVKEAKGLSGAYPFGDDYFTQTFLERAEEAMGEDAWYDFEIELDDAASQVASDDAIDVKERMEEEGAIQEHEIVKTGIEIEKRGTEARRQTFRDNIPTARENLAQAQRKLDDVRAARAKELKKQAKKVISASKKTKMQHDGKPCVVTEFDDKGFSVKVDGAEKRWGWGNCPGDLGHKVKKLALDLSDGQALYDLGLYALRRGLFDQAERDFEQAVKREGALKEKIPAVGEYRHLVKLFRGKHNRNSITKGVDDTEVVWGFKPDRSDQEVLDFKAYNQAMKTEIVGGQLKVSGPDLFPVTVAEVRGAWKGNVEFKTILTTLNPAPIVILSSEGGAYQLRFDQKTELYKGYVGQGTETVASSEVRGTPGSQITLSIQRKGEDQAVVAVKIGERECFTTEALPFEGDAEFTLGAKGGGEVRFGETRVKGLLSEKWAARILASGPNQIQRKLKEFLRKHEVEDTSGPKIAVAFKKTSAEDEVGLADISERHRELVEQGRTLLEQEQQILAADKFKDAANNLNYHAAGYLYAICLLQRDPEGALLKLERACEGIEDFYEAYAAQAEALFWMGRYEQAQEVLQKCLDLRPDYAPAYIAKANLLNAKGKYAEAYEQLELANTLAPGDPLTAQAMIRSLALAEGPNWSVSDHFVREHYDLHTDLVDWGDRFVNQLESIRARYKEAYPALVNPNAPPRVSSVLIFGQAEGYYQYSERTTGDRKENTGGHFSPLSGQLLLYLEDDPSEWDSMHVIFHEGMHQWCHGNGLALPYWANEGMAEYVGGTKLSDDGSRIIERGAIGKFLKRRLQNLTNNWEHREETWQHIMEQSPGEFYSGSNVSLKYGQAWTMIHFIMEGDDQELKDTFGKYLEAFVKVDDKSRESARGGERLTHIYVDTFHQLDMKDIERRWEKHVEKMCRSVGIDWTVPEKKEDE